MDFLTILREALLLIHLVGFAMLFGGWLAQAAKRDYTTNLFFRLGLGVMIVSGLLLAIPFPAAIHLDYLKLGVKLFIALVIGGTFGVVTTKEKKTGRAAVGGFWTIGGLAALNAGIAVFWH